MFIKPKTPKVLWFSVVIIVLFWFPALAQMSSDNYEILVSVMDATGKQKNSDNYKIKDAMGQPTPIGEPKTSTNYKLLSGFIYTEGQIYVPGDANSDRTTNITDAVYIVNWLFIGGPPPCFMTHADANGSGSVDLADAAYIVGWLFLGGPAPVPGCIDP